MRSALFSARSACSSQPRHVAAVVTIVVAIIAPAIINPEPVGADLEFNILAPEAGMGTAVPMPARRAQPIKRLRISNAPTLSTSGDQTGETPLRFIN